MSVTKNDFGISFKEPPEPQAAHLRNASPRQKSRTPNKLKHFLLSLHTPASQRELSSSKTTLLFPFDALSPHNNNILERQAHKKSRDTQTSASCGGDAIRARGCAHVTLMRRIKSPRVLFKYRPPPDENKMRGSRFPRRRRKSFFFFPCCG